jgi:hypothetical protein
MVAIDSMLDRMVELAEIMRSIEHPQTTLTGNERALELRGVDVASREVPRTFGPDRAGLEII